MAKVMIGKTLVGSTKPCFVVAEIGIHHNGSLEIAKKLIDMAVEAGCDAVKFQKRTIDVVYTAAELAKPRESIFGETNGDLKRGLEFGRKQYEAIDAYCRAKDILWFASCWDEDSVSFIRQFDPPCYKIASASLTDDDLLAYTRDQGKPIILSTGMSTLEEIYHAVRILGRSELVILHAVSTYPSEDRDTNLKVMGTLRKNFPVVPIGYSGHEKGISLTLAAVVMGACMVERHITLERMMWGSDHSASLEPEGLKKVVRDIRKFELARGDGVKRVLPAELPIKNKLRRK